MVSQVNSLRRPGIIEEPTVGSIRNMTARIRNQWTSDEKVDRQHQAYLSQQQLLQACGLIPGGELEDVITVAR
jgi:hypothetical protein